MDAGRFDALSKSLASRRSRRSLGAGGLAAGILAAFGVEHASAATSDCSLHIFAKTSAGPHKGTTYTGDLNLKINEKGAIDSGTFDTDDGASHKLVGQATGRAINLRITLEDGKVLALDGTADIDLLLCRGDASGTFGGPGDTDIGTWRTADKSAGNANSSGSNSGGSTSGGGGGSSNGGGGQTSGGSGGGDTSGGNSSGGGGDTGGGGGGCASGVVCGGVCCEPAPGLTADNITCNQGFCECTYSCASAGCNPNGTGSIVNTCGSDPQPHCHSECNVPTDNGCGDMTCGDGQTLDVDSCTCIDDNGGGGGGGCVNPLFNCGDSQNVMCADLQNDASNCGGCGNVCPSGQCIEGNCTDVVK